MRGRLKNAILAKAFAHPQPLEARLKIGRATLRRYSHYTGDDNPVVRYILPDKNIVIGYVVLTEPCDQTLPMQSMTATPLEDPALPVTCALYRSGKGERLYWVVVRQGPGAVWYRWNDHAGATHDFLAFADTASDTTDSRQMTADWARRRQMIWKLMYRFGRSFIITDRVCRAANNRLGTATHAFTLAAYAYDQEGTASKAQRLLEELRADDHSPAACRLYVATGIATDIQHVPDTVAVILRAAVLVFSDESPPTPRRKDRTRRRHQ